MKQVFSTRYLLLTVGVLVSLVTAAQDTIRVPVVVHVVYSEGTQNISNEQIDTQLDVLNRDYNASNSDLFKVIDDFKADIASCHVSFFLTKIDENGNTHLGVTRTATNHGPFGNADIYYSENGGHDAWDSEKFLNVWVCDLTFGVDGLSSFPGGDQATDGVVVDFQSFGTNGTAESPTHLGRTATHEIGHWLGLGHLWGTGGCEDDDGIADTPNQLGASSCDTSAHSCGVLEMAQNFMNTGADSCLLFFTQGQCDSMRSVLENSRKSVIEFGLLASTVSVVNNTLLEIYPNPIPPQGFFLNYKGGYLHAKLFDSRGILRFENLLPAKNGSIFVPTNGLEAGVYYLIATSGRQVYRQQVVMTTTENDQ